MRGLIAGRRVERAPRAPDIDSACCREAWEGEQHTSHSEPQGTVFDLGRCSVHDGPGIRTTLFLKGCPLRCWWCHSPEGIAPTSELLFYEDRCAGCGLCVEVGHCNAIVLTDEIAEIGPELCQACHTCIDICPKNAIQMMDERASA